jgi:hypothetical protein
VSFSVPVFHVLRDPVQNHIHNLKINPEAHEHLTVAEYPKAWQGDERHIAASLSDWADDSVPMVSRMS